MENHFRYTDYNFEQAFLNATFPPSLFNHEAHLRLAWIHLHHYGEATAIENICAQLLNYVDKLNARDKFNKTLTIAAIKAVKHFKDKSQSNNFADFIHEFPRLKHNFKDLIAAHYSFDIYHFLKAKEEFLEPDLLAFG